MPDRWSSGSGGVAASGPGLIGTFDVPPPTPPNQQHHQQPAHLLRRRRRSSSSTTGPFTVLVGCCAFATTVIALVIAAAVLATAFSTIGRRHARLFVAATGDIADSSSKDGAGKPRDAARDLAENVAAALLHRHANNGQSGSSNGNNIYSARRYFAATVPHPSSELRERFLGDDTFRNGSTATAAAYSRGPFLFVLRAATSPTAGDTRMLHAPSRSGTRDESHSSRALRRAIDEGQDEETSENNDTAATPPDGNDRTTKIYGHGANDSDDARVVETSPHDDDDQPSVQPRILYWGDSFGGGHELVVTSAKTTASATTATATAHGGLDNEDDDPTNDGSADSSSSFEESDDAAVAAYPYDVDGVLPGSSSDDYLDETTTDDDVAGETSATATARAAPFDYERLDRFMIGTRDTLSLIAVMCASLFPFVTALAVYSIMLRKRRRCDRHDRSSTRAAGSRNCIDDTTSGSGCNNAPRHADESWTVVYSRRRVRNECADDGGEPGSRTMFAAHAVRGLSYRRMGKLLADDRLCSTSR